MSYFLYTRTSVPIYFNNYYCLGISIICKYSYLQVADIVIQLEMIVLSTFHKTVAILIINIQYIKSIVNNIDTSGGYP